MLGVLSRKYRRPRLAAARSRLHVESLDERVVPSAASFSDLQGRVIGSNIIVYGHVQDDTPGPDVVNASGGVSGTCTTTAEGKFEFIGSYTGDGSVTLYIHNDEGIDSAPTTLSVEPSSENAAPYVSFHVTYGAARAVTFSGVVYDESPSSCTVSITGVASLHGITPSANGAFSVTLTASGLGEVDCQAWDQFAVASNVDFLDLVSKQPVIDSLTVVTLCPGTYQIRGHVTDEWQPGLTVYFGGDVLGVKGRYAVCDPNGNFALNFICTDPTANGVITADCPDWWGLAADQQTYVFHA